MSNNGSSFRGIRNVPGHVPASERSSCPRDPFVTSRMIRIDRRINDVADWLRWCGRTDHPWQVRASLSSVRPGRETIRGQLFLQLFDCCEHAIRILKCSCIDDQNAVWSNRQSNVPACAGQHVKIAANRQYLELRRGGILRTLRLLPPLLCVCDAKGEGRDQQCSECERRIDNVPHLSFFLISGYIVSAPARMTSSGR